jgi:2-dehydro-3-deoxyphosphogluconate aldolase/(4S)-4-hydroxy-2-oxoglutarate aldolase
VPDSLRHRPVIPVLRAGRAADYYKVIEALVDGGLTWIEVTLTTPGTMEALSDLVGRWDATVGVGTVMGEDQARDAIERGAGFLVTPAPRPGVVEVAVQHAVPVFPGGLTPGELIGEWEGGATAVKIFPAQAVGPKYGVHLRGPFPEIEFIPSGGVAVDDIQPWLRAGAVAVSLGGPLLGDAFDGGSTAALRERVRVALDRAAGASAT